MSRDTKGYLSSANKIFQDTKSGLEKIDVKELGNSVSKLFNSTIDSITDIVKDGFKKLRDKKSIRDKVAKSKTKLRDVKDTVVNTARGFTSSTTTGDNIAADELDKDRNNRTSSNDPPESAEEIHKRVSGKNDENEGEEKGLLKDILGTLKEGFNLKEDGRQKTMMEKLKERMAARKEQIEAARGLNSKGGKKKGFFNNPILWLAGFMLGGLKTVLWKMTKTISNGFWGGIWFLAKSLTKGIGKGLFKLGSFLFKLLPGSLQTILKLPFTILGGLKDLGVKLLGGLGTSLKDLGTKIIGGLGGKLKDLGTRIISGLGDKIGGLVGKLGKTTLGKWAGKAIAKIGGKGFLKTMGKAALKFGGKALAVLSGPLGWAVTIGFLLWDAYDIYKALKKPGGDLPDTIQGDIVRARFMSYGFGPYDKENYNKVIECEELAGRFFKYNTSKGDLDFIGADDDTMDRIYKTLEYNGENENHDKNVRVWYRDRFIPAYMSYLRTFWGIREDLKPGNLDKLSKVELSKLVYNWKVPGEVWEIDSMPLLEKPMTTVTKPEFDELMISLKSRLQEEKRTEDAKSSNQTQKERVKENTNSNLYKDNTKEANKPIDTTRSTPLSLSASDINNPFLRKLYNRHTDGNLNSSLEGGQIGSGSGVDAFMRLVQEGSNDPMATLYGGKNNTNVLMNNNYSTELTGIQDYGMTMGDGLGGMTVGNGFVTIDDAMSKAAQATGVPEPILWTFAKAESGLDRNVRAKGSSATGLFQFLKETWEEMIKNKGKKYGLTLYNADRTNPLHSALMAGEYMRMNMDSAKKWTSDGLDLGTSLYLAHFLGNGGSNKLYKKWKANPNAMMKDSVEESQYNANLDAMGGLTINQFLNKYKDRFYYLLKDDPMNYEAYRLERKNYSQAYAGKSLPDPLKDLPNISTINITGNDNGPKKSSPTSNPYTGIETESNIAGGSGGMSSISFGINEGSGGQMTETGIRLGSNNEPVISDTSYGTGTNVAYDSGYGNNASSGGNTGAPDVPIQGVFGDSISTEIQDVAKVHPIAPGYTYYFTSLFGKRNTGIEGASTDHRGVDIGGPAGASSGGIPILATGNGKVIIAQSIPSYGDVVYIDHPQGYQTRYAHLRRGSISVRVGQQVKAGDKIGIMGNTSPELWAKNKGGIGIHLHYEIRKGKGGSNSTSVAQDPFKWKTIGDSYLGHRVPNKNTAEGLPEKTSGGGTNAEPSKDPNYALNASNQGLDNPNLDGMSYDPTTGMSGHSQVVTSNSNTGMGSGSVDYGDSYGTPSSPEESTVQGQEFNVEATVDTSRLEGKSDETNNLLKRMTELLEVVAKGGGIGSVASDATSVVKASKGIRDSRDPHVVNKRNRKGFGMDFSRGFYLDDK